MKLALLAIAAAPHAASGRPVRNEPRSIMTIAAGALALVVYTPFLVLGGAHALVLPESIVSADEPVCRTPEAPDPLSPAAPATFPSASPDPDAVGAPH